MTNDPVSMEFFEAKYQKSADPWGFASSDYEQFRYTEIMSALGGRHFRRAFEPGCSIGILTERLSTVCDEVVAIDISSTAVALARERCKRFPGVKIAPGSLADAPTHGSFDLIMFSEVGYYFTADVLRDLIANLVKRLEPDSVLLAAHWLGYSADHILCGDEVHQVLNTARGLRRTSSARYDQFRIDVLMADPRSSG